LDVLCERDDGLGQFSQKLAENVGGVRGRVAALHVEFLAVLFDSSQTNIPQTEGAALHQAASRTLL
jgi:hypothetical protein